MFGKVDVTTDIVYSQDIQQLETRSHMSWLPQEKLTTEEKETIQDYQRIMRKKIDKTVYSTDELQAYAIYQPALDIYKETKDRATIKYNKELETLELELNKVAWEINKKMKEQLIKS